MATTERPETPPVPASTILPFDRDPDYVERGSLLKAPHELHADNLAKDAIRSTWCFALALYSAA
jgi:hypothetical protein